MRFDIFFILFYLIDLNKIQKYCKIKLTFFNINKGIVNKIKPPSQRLNEDNICFGDQLKSFQKSVEFW